MITGTIKSQEEKSWETFWLIESHPDDIIVKLKKRYQ